MENGLFLLDGMHLIHMYTKYFNDWICDKFLTMFLDWTREFFQAKTFLLLSYSRTKLVEKWFRPASIGVKYLDMKQASVTTNYWWSIGIRVAHCILKRSATISSMLKEVYKSNSARSKFEFVLDPVRNHCICVETLIKRQNSNIFISITNDIFFLLFLPGIVPSVQSNGSQVFYRAPHCAGASHVLK